MKKNTLLSLLLFMLLALPWEVSGKVYKIDTGGYKIIEGRLVEKKLAPTMSAQDHYAEGLLAMDKKDWQEACRHFHIIALHFNNFEHISDAIYLLGVSYYHLDQFDFANNTFSKYLQKAVSSKYFENIIEYKFAIAEQFRSGAKRHLFGSSKFPKWLSGKKVALEIYDEIATSVTGSEIAAKAMFSKAKLLQETKEYKESIDVYRDLTKSFPKSSYASKSYLSIAEIYLHKISYENQNPDLLSLAYVNLENFRNSFPRDEKIKKAENLYNKMKEIYARGFYETAQLYERMKKPKASAIYYASVIRQFPDTNIAKNCIKRLSKLQPSIHQLNLPKELLQ